MSPVKLITVLAVVLALTGGLAVAREQPYVSLECQDLGDPTPKIASREACRAKLVADKKMHANLKNVLRVDIHAEDANTIARNHRHVIIAYAALWILAVAFLLLLFFRQRALTAEISRLSTELDRAVREEE